MTEDLSHLTRVKMGRLFLAMFIEMKGMTISSIAERHGLKPSTVLWLMSEAMKEDEYESKRRSS